MTTETTQKTEKKLVTRTEFEKKVDIERAHYEYFDRLSPEAARLKALEEVAKEYRYKT